MTIVFFMPTPSSATMYGIKRSHPAADALCANAPDGDSARVLYLTFDDGPHKRVTPAILKTLHEAKVPASFFVVGERVVGSGAELVLEEAADGHTIGNHSYSHRDLTALSVTEAHEELVLTANLLALMGMYVKYVRPPFGRLNSTVYEIIKELRAEIALWNNDPRDWSGDAKPDGWVKNTLRGVAENRNVVLLHDIHDTTAEHLPRLLDELLAKGYVFAKLGDNGTAPPSV